MKKNDSKHATSPERVSNIIQAALMCFTELGYNDTSMTDICTKANASIGSIYHHFKNKEHLAAAVYLKGIEVYQLGILQILNKEKDAFKGISAIIKYHFKWIIDNSEWSQFLFQKRYSFNSNEIEKNLSILNEKFGQGISEWFKNHCEAGTIRPLALDLLIVILFGPVLEYTKLYLSKKNITPHNKAIDDLILSAWNSMTNKK